MTFNGFHQPEIQNQTFSPFSNSFNANLNDAPSEQPRYSFTKKISNKYKTTDTAVNLIIMNTTPPDYYYTSYRHQARMY